MHTQIRVEGRIDATHQQAAVREASAGACHALDAASPDRLTVATSTGHVARRGRARGRSESGLSPMIAVRVQLRESPYPRAGYSR